MNNCPGHTDGIHRFDFLGCCYGEGCEANEPDSVFTHRPLTIRARSISQTGLVIGEAVFAAYAPTQYVIRDAQDTTLGRASTLEAVQAWCKRRNHIMVTEPIQRACFKVVEVEPIHMLGE